MNIDERARRAAERLRRAVDRAPLLMMERTIDRPRGRPSRLLSFAGAFAGVLLLLGLTLVQVDLFAPDRDNTTPTQATFPTDGTRPAPSTTVTAHPTTTTPATTTTAAVPSQPVTTTEPPDTEPPALTITYPAAGETVAEPKLRFEGTTEPGAKVTAGPYEATVGPEGGWSIVLVLNEGGNLARFTATDAAGNTSEATVSVTYEAPAPPKPPPSDFTAHNIWGTCELDPPYDEYYGTGRPGTGVRVVSEYGSGSTVVAANGEWYLKVYFETAPFGVTFPVKVKDDFGGVKVFEFTSTAGA